MSFTTRIKMLIAVSAVLLASCSKEEDPEVLSPEEYLENAINSIDQAQLATDIQIIDDSLALWELTDIILTEPYGVRYKIDSLAEGQKPMLNSVIRIKYSGKLLSTGAEFDASESLQYYLYSLIPGFQTALPLIPKGSKVTLYIPSGLAYGPEDINDNTGKTILPGNSNLIFEIELLDVF